MTLLIAYMLMVHMGVSSVENYLGVFALWILHVLWNAFRD